MTTPLLFDPWTDSTTADTGVNATERPLESLPLYIAEKYLRILYFPFLFLSGVFGNVMTIIIMRRATSGDSTIHIYFVTTAVFDLSVLCTSVLLSWLQSVVGFHVVASHNVLCKLIMWTFAGSRAISAWCVVCMTVHRAMSVVWPHRVNVLCTRRTVLLVLTGIIVFIALLYSHALIGFARLYSDVDKKYVCTVRGDDPIYLYFFQNIVVYKDLSVYCIVPFCLLVVSNSVLIWKLCISVKAANRTLTQGDSEQVQSREKAAKAVTLTVIVVSMAFVALTLPTSINFIMNFLFRVQNSSSRLEHAKTSFIHSLGEMLGITNSAVNFYLYCLTGRRFREEFIKVMCCGRNRRGPVA